MTQPRTIQPTDNWLGRLMLKLTRYMPVRRSRLIRAEQQNAKLWDVNRELRINNEFLRQDYVTLMSDAPNTRISDVKYVEDIRPHDEFVDMVRVYFEPITIAHARPPIRPDELHEYTKFMMQDVSRQLARLHAEDSHAPMIYDWAMRLRDDSKT